MALLAGWGVVGGLGVAGYWSSYDVHRGFAPVRRVRHSGRGDNVIVHFYSEALHREFDYRVFLPSHYDPRRHRYPVYYLLHGSPGRPQVYIAIADMGVRLDNLIALHKARPMILVFPDGRIGGSTMSDSEWANTPAGDYESYVLDVVRDVDRRFSVIVSRRERMIAGFSMGGYGAANIALHHLAVFAHLQVWSGYFLQTRSGVFAHATRAELFDNSPLEYVGHLRGELRRFPLDAYLFVGRGDHDSRQILPMAAAMRAAGVRVSDRIFAGGHDWELWNAHVDEMIVRASNAFGGPALGPPPRHPILRPVRTFSRHRHRHGDPHRHGDGHRQARRSAAALQLDALRRPLRQRRPIDLGVLVGSLALALVSAALINLGFLLQHRGIAGQAGVGTLRGLRRSVTSRAWLSGQLVGWVGFAAQIVAVVLAPLSLVQAFAAGGLALSVPLAARAFGHRIGRGQRLAVLLVAAALAVLPIAAATGHDRLDARRLALTVAGFLVLGTGAAARRTGTGRALAAGVFYGAADAGIKAIAVRWGAHGLAALLSPWTLLAVLGTFAGFLAFQAALRRGGAVGSITLMTAAAALVALGCGLLGLGESLGAGDPVIALHLAAILLVLACVRPLAAAHADLTEAGHAAPEPRSEPLQRIQ